MRVDLPARDRTTLRCRACVRRMAHSAYPSSAAGHLDLACDDVFLDRFDPSVYGVGNQRLVVLIIHVAHSAFLEPERIHAAAERPVMDPADGVEGSCVYSLHH